MSRIPWPAIPPGWQVKKVKAGGFYGRSMRLTPIEGGETVLVWSANDSPTYAHLAPGWAAHRGGLSGSGETADEALAALDAAWAALEQWKAEQRARPREAESAPASAPDHSSWSGGRHGEGPPLYGRD